MGRFFPRKKCILQFWFALGHRKPEKPIKAHSLLCAYSLYCLWLVPPLSWGWDLPSPVPCSLTCIWSSAIDTSPQHLHASDRVALTSNCFALIAYDPRSASICFALRIMALVPLLLFLLLHRKLNLLLSLSLPFHMPMISDYPSHRALYSGSVLLNQNHSDICRVFYLSNL